MRRRALVPHVLRAAVAASSLVMLVSCADSAANSGKVEHLPIPGARAIKTGDLTIRCAVLTASRTFVWRVSAGPARVLDLEYRPTSQNQKPELEVTWRSLFLPISRRLAVAGSSDGESDVLSKQGWVRGRVLVPAFRFPGRLRLTLRPARGSEVDFAEPVLAAVAPEPRLVVLFDIDTLRRDRLSIDGYRLVTSPRIDRYFHDGTVWKNCFSNVPWTLPSHATMFTSVLPNRLGVGDRLAGLPLHQPVLAESFRKAGWRTIAVTSGGYVDPGFGFDRGFDVYEASAGLISKEIDDALSLLKTFNGEKVFLFFHTYQVHNYRWTERAATELFGAEEAVLQDPNRAEKDTDPTEPRSRGEMDAISRRYDVAIRSCDDSFGDLIDELARRKNLGNTAIFLTSDHGEELFDRSFPDKPQRFISGHPHPYLYDEYLAVPMMAKIPWMRPAVRSAGDAVSLNDLAPSILEAVDLRAPASFEGRSMFRSSPGTIPAGMLFAEAPGLEAFSVRAGSRKLIDRNGYRHHNGIDGRYYGPAATEECFDVGRDPGERMPLPCGGSEWAALHRAEWEALEDVLPGAVVWRIPAMAESREVAITAADASAAPEVFAYGTDPTQAFWTDGRALRGRFRSGAGPAWIAIRPKFRGEAVTLKLWGVDKMPSIENSSSSSSEMVVTWSSLVRRAPGDLHGSGSELFVTHPSSREDPNDRSASAPPEALARLKNLGYLAGGPQGGAGGQWPIRVPELIAEIPPLPPEGSIRISISPDLPGWRLPSRQLTSLQPAETVAGTVFNRQPSGDAAISIQGIGLTVDDVVYWNGMALETTYASSQTITALIPRSFLDRPGQVSLEVRSKPGGDRERLSAIFKILP